MQTIREMGSIGASSRAGSTGRAAQPRHPRPPCRTRSRFSGSGLRPLTSIRPSPASSPPTPPTGRADQPVGVLEARDEAALPGCLNGAWRIMLADVGDRLTVGYPIEHGEAGQGRAGASVSAGTGDLDAFGLGACPCLAQRVGGCCAVGWQPEVGPAKPSVFPGHGRWPVAKQVEREGGLRALRERPAQSPAADESARGQSQHARRRGLPWSGHGTNVAVPSGCWSGGFQVSAAPADAILAADAVDLAPEAVCGAPCRYARLWFLCESDHGFTRRGCGRGAARCARRCARRRSAGPGRCGRAQRHRRCHGPPRRRRRAWSGQRPVRLAAAGGRTTRRSPPGPRLRQCAPPTDPGVVQPGGARGRPGR